MASHNKNATPISDTAPPSWLNMELIQKALRNDRDPECQVRSISVSRAIAPGDNYLSIIYRVKVELSDGTQRSVIVKSLPEGEELVAYLESSKTFEKEGTMLGVAIPRMQALLEEGAPRRWQPMAARCPLYCSKYLILEDFGPQGFRIADRLRGLGIRHCLIALRTLARFHASSHALLKKDPSIREKIASTATDPMDKLGEFVVAGIEGGANACKEWPGFEEYSEKLMKLKDIFLDKIREFYNPKPEAFWVISHGDFWVNNMMFCYDEEGLPCDLRMVDLQLSVVTSPTLDVMYFLGTSPHESVFQNYEDFLIREYYFALQEASATLGIKAPTLEEFMIEMDAHSAYYMFAVLGASPIIKSEKEADFDAAMAGDAEAISVLYTRPLVKKWVQRVLPILNQKGYLDV